MKIFKNKALFQFILRVVIFFAILFGTYLFIALYFRHTPFFLKYLSLPPQFYFNFISGLRKTDFINAALFTSIVFLIWNRGKIKDLKEYTQDKKQTIVFGILALIVQVGHYFFKYWAKTSIFAISNTLLMTLTKYLFNISFVILVAFAVYNLEIIKDYSNMLKRQLPIFAGVLVVYFFLIQFFQMIWRFLGDSVARAVYFLLSITLNNAVLKMEELKTPILGVGQFIVGISQECSGIDSLLLFISLFTVLFVLDWNRMNKFRMFFLGFVGIFCTIFYNILRVYLLILVGVYISPEFAIDMFHTNIGWILFLVFFIVFWHFGSNWVYIEKKGKN